MIGFNLNLFHCYQDKIVKDLRFENYWMLKPAYTVGGRVWYNDNVVCIIQWLNFNIILRPPQ